LSIPRAAALRLGAALLGLALISGCATPRAALLPAPAEAPAEAPPEALPTAVLEPGAALSLDQYRLKLPFTLDLDNSRGAALALEALDCRLLVEGSEAGRLSYREPKTLAGGESLSLPFEFALDMRDLDPSISGLEGPAAAAWRAETRLVLKTGAGKTLELGSQASGSFPIIREPRFRIYSVKIERDLLVTTQLALGLEISNPNAFPLVFRSFDYDFYGEGKIWADGASDDAASIPARGSLRRSLRFTMNFADMDRRLFDLVAKLKVVRYRLAGQAGMATGLDFLPAFVTTFDDEGSCAVER
jgi:LEA14-like dessication related protein